MFTTIFARLWTYTDNTAALMCITYHVMHICWHGIYLSFKHLNTVFSRTPIIEFVGWIHWWPWISETNLVNGWVFDWMCQCQNESGKSGNHCTQSDLSFCFSLLLPFYITIQNYSHASAFYQLYVVVHNSDYIKRVQYFHNFICFATTCRPMSWDSLWNEAHYFY